MALVIHWYDYICFAIVGVCFICSLWILLWKEHGSEKNLNTKYESLLVAQLDTNVFIDAMPINHVGSSQLWSSCWKGFHPGWLLVTRFISFLIMGGVLLWDISKSGATIFVYYTEWTFTLVMLYFALAIAASAYGCWISSESDNDETAVSLKMDVEGVGITNSATYRAERIIKLQIHYAGEAIKLRAGFWGYLMQTVYQTSAGAVVLTDVIFWCVIVPFDSNEHLQLNVLTGCMHTLNAAFLLMDTTVNNLTFPWFRIAYFIQWSCLYVVFQWVIHAFGFTWWPYPFLNLENPWAPIWYFVLALLHIPCYGVYALIVRAKYSIFPKWFPHAFVGYY